MVKNIIIRGNALFGYQFVTIKNTGKRFKNFNIVSKPVNNKIITNNMIKKTRNNSYLPRKEINNYKVNDKQLVKRKYVI